jgi:hypothetical protein
VRKRNPVDKSISREYHPAQVLPAHGHQPALKADGEWRMPVGGDLTANSVLPLQGSYLFHYCSPPRAMPWAVPPETDSAPMGLAWRFDFGARAFDFAHCTFQAALRTSHRRFSGGSSCTSSAMLICDRRWTRQGTS